MLKYILSFFALFATVAQSSPNNCTQLSTIPTNNCIQFSVSSGTGCTWMCNYCATNLGTSNYYFTDSVCTYQQGGCVGNPISGNTYKCCSL
jgi:hypothetical protein